MARPWQWWRPFRRALLAIVLIPGVVQLAILGSVGLARTTGHDPHARGGQLPHIAHLRRVDDRVWAGGQPNRDAYRGLADMGVELVVDMRTGVPSDPRDDDPGFLRSLGMDHLWIPVRDGHAPTTDDVRRFAAAVAAADGPVYLHCGGGVGRSTSMEAAYMALEGNDPAVLRQLAVGPPTVEQIWYVSRLEPGDLGAANTLVARLSRSFFDAPRTAVNWVRGRL